MTLFVGEFSIGSHLDLPKDSISQATKKVRRWLDNSLGMEDHIVYENGVKVNITDR